jgi:phage/plasmid-like protein (TIGR03299 family)
MASELDMSKGRAAIAFTGQTPWHGLGSQLTEDAPLEVWKTEAGMDFDVLESPVAYAAPALGELPPRNLIFPAKKALYRSDDHAPLSIVGTGFKVVQPTEVLEFFRDLLANNNMKMSTAGVLFGGRRFWAMAELDKSDYIVDGDRILGKLLLTTAVDGSLATTAKFVSERVVCNNTLTIAMNESTKNVVRVVHSTEWDATKVKIDLGLIDSAWEKFITDMRKLAMVQISDQDAKSYYQKKFYDKKLDANEQTWGTIKKVNDLMDLLKNGAGSDLSRGTRWGVVNAVTDLYTHGNGRKQDPSNKFWSAFYESDKIKQEVVDDMLALS